MMLGMCHSESLHGAKQMTFDSFPDIFLTSVCFDLDGCFYKLSSVGHNPFSTLVGYFISQLPQPVGEIERKRIN